MRQIGARFGEAGRGDALRVIGEGRRTKDVLVGGVRRQKAIRDPDETPFHPSMLLRGDYTSVRNE